MVELTAPYIPGFLAFREADFLVEKIDALRETNPEILPQVRKKFDNLISFLKFSLCFYFLIKVIIKLYFGGYSVL